MEITLVMRQGRVLCIERALLDAQQSLGGLSAVSVHRCGTPFRPDSSDFRRAHVGRLFSAEVHLESTGNSACFFQSKTVRHAWWFRVAKSGPAQDVVSHSVSSRRRFHVSGCRCMRPPGEHRNAIGFQCEIHGVRKNSEMIARPTPSSMIGNWSGLLMSLAKMVLTCVSKRTPRPMCLRLDRNAASKSLQLSSDEISSRHIQRAVRRRARLCCGFPTTGAT